ncbi:MAG: hypothetical protein KDA68_07205 [Planctomycetaceae bacterium]|nr:hypothetical protein [Planctomycetaceae bacterium]MCA9093257.1 hypothetical protein [Planctomycetaceae bacterium]
MSEQADRDIKLSKKLIDELYGYRKACLRTILIAPAFCLLLFVFFALIGVTTDDPIFVVCVFVFVITIIIVVAQIVRVISIDQTIWLIKRFQTHRSAETSDFSPIDESSGPEPTRE